MMKIRVLGRKNESVSPEPVRSAFPPELSQCVGVGPGLAFARAALFDARRRFDNDAFDGGAAQRMAELLPHGELAVITNCGHTPNMENPEEFDAALGTFLGKLS